MPTRDALVNAKLGMREEIPPLGELFGQGFIKPIPLMSQQWQPGLQSYGPGFGTAAPAAPAPVISGWHGTGATFTPEPGAPLGRFNPEMIGTGEGNAAYGRGTYIAENRGTAESYRTMLAQDRPVEGGPNNTKLPAWVGNDLDQGGNPQSHIDLFNGRIRDMQAQIDAGANQPWHLKSNIAGLKDIVANLEAIRDGKAKMSSGGSLYQVNINADPAHFLDWDKPLSQQEPFVSDALSQILKPSDRMPFAYLRSSPGAEQRMQEAGIPGIKYLDQMSRQSGQGTRNYVVFDPKIIDIINKYGIGGAIAAGLISQEQAQLAQQQGLGATDQTTDQRDKMTRAAMGF